MIDLHVEADDVLPRVKRFYIKTDVEAVLRQRHARYDAADFYRPIELVVSGSNECNVLCRACGLSSVRPGSSSVRRIPKETIANLLDEAADCGFVSYLCSFEAEPFADLRTLEELIPRFRGRLDPSKLNTSCSEFDSVGAAVALLRRLKRAGWSDTAFFVPVLSLSLGLQQNPGNARPVPIRNVINGIIGFREVFADLRDATLAISHYYGGHRAEIDALALLADGYRSTTGEDVFDDAIVKSREVIRTGRARGGMHDTKPLREAVNVKRCFKLSFDDECMAPTLEVDLAYRLSRRAFCCYHSLGRYPDTNLAEAIRIANADPFFRIHAHGGTRAIYDALAPGCPGLGERRVRDGHHACSVLRQVAASDPALWQRVTQAAVDPSEVSTGGGEFAQN